ncbi:MAG: YbbR-like domain-containing protein [Bacteroidaceae bacterium]|nr:YbbR-like domain-containing protein [Bacteroidaceae bacterium]
MQTLDETFETEIVVPLELVDVPEEVVVTTPLPDQLRVTVKEKGTTLLRYWNHKIPPVQIPFPDYDNGTANGRVRLSPSEIQKAVQERLFSSSKVQSIRPDTLEFYYNHGMHAMVPVVVTGEVETNPRFYLMELQTDPADVKVFAASSTLDTLTAVRTVPVSLTDLKENTTVEVKLAPIRGAKVEPDRVNVTALVDVYMESSVEVPVVSLNFPGDKQLRTFPSTIKVTYTIGYARSKEVTRRNFVFVITYEELLELQNQGVTKIPVHLKTIPEGVTNVRFEPQELDFLVENINEED